MIIELIVIGLLIGLDQLVKYWTVITLKGNDSIILLDKVFELTYVENRGAAFGMMQNQRPFFLIFTLLVVVIVYFYLLKIPRIKRYSPLRITILLFLAGALGNWIDRYRLSYVVDTFYFSIIDFPVFNVADSYVVISTFLFAILLMFYYKDHEFDFMKIKKIKKENK